MNALMNIQIRVLSAQAQAEIKALRARVRELELQLASANKASSSFGAAGLRSIEKWGSQMQWAGRQLQYNFTIPLVLAGGAATKFALDNERAMTRLQKVYGDGTRDAQFYRKEIGALGRAFESLSNEFGVARADVINIAADWAAAGASGLALAKNTRLTIETMILGEMDAETATQSLIAIQAQYGQSTKDLATTIDVLNQVENQTGASMSGLIEGFVRAAGVARDAGIDVRHLAAMIAALVPAAGSAAQAGNAIKTIVSRILSPTKEAAEVMGLMGINTAKMSWETLNGTQRLEAMAKRFNQLDTAQKTVVSSVIASRWQINKFSTLMRDITNVNGYYQKSLNATIDPLANQAQKVRELNAVLDSNPQKFKQIGVIMQNVLADAIQPLLPDLVRLGQAVAGTLKKFQELDPNVQKLMMLFLLLLAAIGPVMRYIGSLGTLYGYLATATLKASGAMGFLLGGLWKIAKFPFILIWSGITGISTAFLTMIKTLTGGSFIATALTRMRMIGTAIAAAFTGPWGIAIAAVVGLVLIFRDQLGTMFQSISRAWQGNVTNLARAFAPVTEFFGRAVQFISDAFWRLPKSVRDVMVAIITMVRTAAENIANFFSSIFGGAQDTAARTAASTRVAQTPNTRYERQALNRANGGLLRGAGTGTSDSIPVLASNGEFIVNARATSKHHDELVRINADRYSRGGLVGWQRFAGGGTVSTKPPAGSTSGMNADLASYQRIADAMNGIKWNNEMKNVAKGLSSALPLFKNLLGDYQMLNRLALSQAAAVTRQEAAVAGWKARLDAANASIDVQQKKLDGLQEKLDSLTQSYDAHKQALQNYANAPIEGMGAMSDAIFDNQMAQKKLQLQMAEWEQQHGSIDSVRNSLALLQGQIEKVQGTANELRSAGAGGDITGPLDAQVQAMKDQYASMAGAVQNSPITQMESQLADLQKQGEILDLENSIQFDPMTRAIDQLANGMKELPFAEIIAGIKSEQDAMDALQPKIDAANAAIEKQKTVIDAATVARDAIQGRYDAEQKALDALQAAYGKTKDAINAVEDAMRGLSTAANDNIQAAKEAAANKLSPGAQNFINAEGANFPTVGTNAKIGREGGLADQSAEIDQWLKDTAKQLSFDGIDIFKPIREQWDKAWAWVEKNIAPVVTDMWNAVYQFISDIFGGTGGSSLFKGIGDGFKSVWTTLQGWWNSFLDGMKQLWLLFGDDLTMIFSAIGDFFRRIWDDVGPALSGLFDSLKNAWPWISDAIGTLVKLLGGGLLLAIRVVSAVFSQVLGPVLNTVVDVFLAIIKVAQGVIDFFTNLFAGNLQDAGYAIIGIFRGLWDAVFAIFNGVGRTLFAIVQGVVDGIVGFFKWLWDVLVGHSIIPDLIHAIVDWFVNCGKWLQTTVSTFIGNVIAFFATLPGKIWDGLISLKDKLGTIASVAWTAFWTAAKTQWGNIITWITGLPQAGYDKFIELKNKWGNIAVSAFNYFMSEGKRIWGNIVAWVTGLPQAGYDKFIELKNKWGNIAVSAFNYFMSEGKRIWGNITSWFGGLPQAGYDKFIDIKDKFITVAGAAMGGFFTKVKSLWDGPNGILSWFGGIPGKIAEKLSGIGGVLSGIVRTSWNTAAGWINTHAIQGIRDIASKFGLNIPYLPGFKDGGIIPGGRSARDNMVIRARSGEGVLIPEAVDRIGGKNGLEKLNETARRGGDIQDWLTKTGQVPKRSDFGVGGSLVEDALDWLKRGAGSAVAGILDPVSGFIQDHFPNPEMLSKFLSGTVKNLAAEARKWGQKSDPGMFTGGTPGTYWPVGDVPINAYFGHYPNSTKAHTGIDFNVPTGTPVHAFRAGRVFEAGWDTSGYGFAMRIAHQNGYQTIYAHNAALLKNVGDIVSPGTIISRSDNTGNSSGPHLHFGVKDPSGRWVDPWPFLQGKQFDAGGYLMPGMTAARNATGKPEPVFTSAQWATLSGLVATSSNLIKSVSDAQRGSGMGVYGARAVQIEQRLRALEAKTSTTASGQPSVTVNINGDLVLPNIRSGDDADKFIKHLTSLAG